MKYKILLLVLSSGFFLFAQESNLSLSYNNMLYENLEHNILTDSINITRQKAQSKKSVGSALFLSLLIPGAGEYYADNTFYTKIFFGIEVVAVGSILFSDYLYRSKVKDNKIFASTHAGINRSKKSDKYWRVIGKYNDIFLYNEQRRKDRLTGDVFAENEFNNWSWDSRENRVKYDRKRIHAQVLRDSEIFIMSAILVNHIVSAINAVRLTRKYNKNLANSGYNYNLVINPGNHDNRYIGLFLSRSF